MSKYWVSAFIGLSLCVTAPFSQGADEAGTAYKSIPVDPQYQANLSGEGYRVLHGCVASIRKSSPESYFEARIEETSVMYQGTEEERFQLEKCMAQYGVPITTMHVRGRPN